MGTLVECPIFHWLGFLFAANYFQNTTRNVLSVFAGIPQDGKQEVTTCN